jgi:hypothetical protein
MDTAAFEAYLEAQADIFEREKPYLRDRWQTASEGARRP